MLQKAPQDERRYAGLALPDTPSFKNRINAVTSSLDHLQLRVFWVGPDRSVVVSLPLPD